jgi:hypothetical protein
VTTTTSAAADHPAWCHRPYCTLEQHCSRLMTTVDERTRLKIIAQVCQHPPIDGYPDSATPFVDIAVQYADDGPEHPALDLHFAISGVMAHDVGQILLSAGKVLTRP